MWDLITADLSAVTGQPFQLQRHWSVGGGSINQCYGISHGQQRYFVKLNQASRVGMFAQEASGLKALAATQTLRIPKVFCWGTAATVSYLVLEWLELEQEPQKGHQQPWQQMGQQLAQLHRQGIGPAFGWHEQNVIGSTPQPNPWTPEWWVFWQQHRLGYQLKLAQRRGGHFPQADQLLAAIPGLLANHQPQPSLVHGDLWGGNAGFTATGEPLIFDPAVYYGDREVDLAMTSLFGGFPPAFYQGYQQEWPLPPGHETRKLLYNLYHVINHFNLFGGSYLSQANQIIARLL